jgi:hypothetical protein
MSLDIFNFVGYFVLSSISNEIILYGVSDFILPYTKSFVSFEQNKNWRENH